MFLNDLVVDIFKIDINYKYKEKLINLIEERSKNIVVFNAKNKLDSLVKENFYKSKLFLLALFDITYDKNNYRESEEFRFTVGRLLINMADVIHRYLETNLNTIDNNIFKDMSILNNTLSFVDTNKEGSKKVNIELDDYLDRIEYFGINVQSILYILAVVQLTMSNEYISYNKEKIRI